MYPKVTDKPRKAFVVVLNMRSTEKFECVIDIKQKHLESKTASRALEHEIINSVGEHLGALWLNCLKHVRVKSCGGFCVNW